MSLLKILGPSELWFSSLSLTSPLPPNATSLIRPDIRCNEMVEYY